MADEVNDRLQLLARRPRRASAAKGLLPAIKILEKLGLLPLTDFSRHWMQVEGIRRISAPNTDLRVFAETANLEHFGRTREHWSWVRLFFFSLCAAVFRMRSADLESVTWACMGTTKWIEFFDEKSTNTGWHTLCSFSWRSGESRKYVYGQRHPGTLEASPGPQRCTQSLFSQA